MLAVSLYHSSVSVEFVKVEWLISAWQLDKGGGITFGSYCSIDKLLVVGFTQLTPVPIQRFTYMHSVLQCQCPALWIGCGWSGCTPTWKTMNIFHAGCNTKNAGALKSVICVVVSEKVGDVHIGFVKVWFFWTDSITIEFLNKDQTVWVLW